MATTRLTLSATPGRPYASFIPKLQFIDLVVVDLVEGYNVVVSLVEDYRTAVDLVENYSVTVEER